MNWQEIKVSADNTYFLFDSKQIFGKSFLEVLKFHSPGLAPERAGTGLRTGIQGARGEARAREPAVRRGDDGGVAGDG